ncbi:hypothetical protein ACQP3D_28870, partial [Escherichia coli]
RRGSKVIQTNPVQKNPKRANNNNNKKKKNTKNKNKNNTKGGTCLYFQNSVDSCRRISVSLRLAWCTEEMPVQALNLNGETLSQNAK